MNWLWTNLLLLLILTQFSTYFHWAVPDSAVLLQVSAEIQFNANGKLQNHTKFWVLV
jgi:hypothetical protein